MDQVQRYCEAHHQLQMMQREQRGRTTDVRERRAFALAALGEEFKARELQACCADVNGKRVYVFVGTSKRTRVPSAEELHALIDRLPRVSDGDDAADRVREALLGPFERAVPGGVRVSARAPSTFVAAPEPLPAALMEHVSAVVDADRALANARRASKEAQVAMRKECKETKEGAIAALKSGGRTVAVQTSRGLDYRARLKQTTRQRKVSLRQLADVAHRVAAECRARPIEALRDALKSAVDETYDDEGGDATVVDAVQYAAA